MEIAEISAFADIFRLRMVSLCTLKTSIKSLFFGLCHVDKLFKQTLSKKYARQLSSNEKMFER